MIGRCVANRPQLNLRFQGDTNDHSINNYTVTTFNSPTNGNGILGQANGSIDFNGTNQYLTLTSAVNQMISQDINANATISFWLYADNVTSTQGIISTYDNTVQNSFNLQIQNVANQKLSFPKINGVTFYAFANGDINISQWYFIAFVFNVNDVTLYIDGIEIATSTYGGTAKEDSTNTVWVARRGDGNYLNGRLSDLRENNKTFTAGQIKILNNEKGRIRA